MVEGDCFFVSQLASGDTMLSVYPCTEPHTAEVVGTVATLAAETTFSESYLDGLGTAYCPQMFQGYVGEPPAQGYWLTSEYLKPSEVAWDAGVRTVVCFARTTDFSQISESVKGSA
jgi:hypothetical protein